MTLKNIDTPSGRVENWHRILNSNLSWQKRIEWLYKINQYQGIRHSCNRDWLILIYLGDVERVEQIIREKSERVSGVKNPAYNHGGKFSPFSEKNIFGANPEDAKRKGNLTRLKNESYNTRKGYWLKRGFTDEEASKLIKERQTTFSLEKCISKWGEEEGTRKFNERQLKWLETLNSKSDDEKAEINKKKVYKSGIASKNEKAIYEHLKKIFEGVEDQFCIRRVDDASRYYLYDMRYHNKIIEYNGDLWHANPLLYRPDEVVKFPGNTLKSESIWKKDQEKIELAKSNGFDVLVVWEKDYKENPEKVIQECINFLTV